MISELDLAAVLRHCRGLLDAADQLESVGSARDATIDDALQMWRGPHGRTFRDRSNDEAGDRREVVAGLRREANSWARVWADTVNQVNRDRREAAVVEVSGSRGFGERLVDVAVGDDSAQQVRPFDAVSVPTVANRYAATGGYERY